MRGLSSACSTRSNMQRCRVVAANKPLACNKELDIVFLLDGSGSLGRRGWQAEIKAAQTFVDAFDGTGAKTAMGAQSGFSARNTAAAVAGRKNDVSRPARSSS